MPKPTIAGRAPLRRGSPRLSEMASVVEGEITELCRDVAEAVKRMQRLQAQTDELRLAIRKWVGDSEPPSYDYVKA
jgi:hypothetical protein